MTRKLPSLTTWLATLFLTVPAAHADNTAALDGWPDWVRDSMEDEARRLKYRDVTTPDDAMRTRLPGKPAEPQAIEEGWYFTADIKSDSPMECYLFTSGRDLATLTSIIAEANIEAVGNKHGTVANRQVFHTDAGEIAGMPYLALEWLYTVESDAQRLVAFTKVRAAGKGDTALACAHNNLGFRDTFRQAFAEFVGSAEMSDAAPEPFYEDITYVDINGIGPGIIYSAFSTDEDGDIRAEIAESTIVPVDPSTIMTSDSYTVSYSAPDGTTISAYDISVENGEIGSNMSLQRNEAGAWISSGTLQGKELEYEIDGTLEPASEWRQLALARDLFAGDDQTTSMLAWVPDADPTQFLEAHITRDDADVDRQATLTLGPLEMTGRFDEFGGLVGGDINFGPAQMKLERVWFRGSLER